MAVQEINDKQFIDHLENHNKVMIRFYADWCGSCRLFEPKYKELSEDNRFDDISFVDIDAENNPESRKAIGVDNLPYFAVFQEGDLMAKDNTTKKDEVVNMLEQLNQKSHASQ